MTGAPEEAGASPSAPRPLHEMRLRSARAPVTRLSRKVLLALSTLATLGVGGALVIALQPQRQKAASELYNTESRPAPEGLAVLPKDYAGLPHATPQLGPPLPGDLGRPIAGAGAPAPGMALPAAPADPEAERLAQEREAARTSHLFATTNVAVAAAPTPVAVPQAVTPAAASASGDPASQDHKLAFLNGRTDRTTVSPDRLEAPASPYVLQAGAVIAAALITGLRSDLPGQVTAQVTEDVYDSPTGTFLLIPQGARLVGQYDVQIAFGQSRALLVWNRLIMPNGRSIVLERQPAADPEGYAGLEDEVDNHLGLAVQGRDPLDHPQRRVGSGYQQQRELAGAGDPPGNLGQPQPDGPSGRAALPQRPADDHHSPGLPGPGDRHPRSHIRLVEYEIICRLRDYAALRG